MGETLEDMDKQIKLKDNKNNYLADTVGFSDKQIIHGMEQTNIIRTLDRQNRVIKRLDYTFKHKNSLTPKKTAIINKSNGE